MKIIKIGEPQVIMSNPFGKHNYFGWPTAARLQNGKIAVVASGFRLRHICPFGKAVISYSEDEGKTYTAPAAIIDSPLDDRDGGIATFGKSGVIVTSFNNKISFQKDTAEYYGQEYLTEEQKAKVTEYGKAYCETVSEEEEEKFLGSTFRISSDCGVTFGPIFKAPVSSPHGPVELKDGTLLWVGTAWGGNLKDPYRIQAYKIFPDGTSEFVGKIENAEVEGFDPFTCEPHAIETDDGRIIVQSRVQKVKEPGKNHVFTVFQSESSDGGKTWTKPIQLLPNLGGSPPHLFKHSSGALISSYLYHEGPYCVRAMVSDDGGRNWKTGPDNNIFVSEVTDDMGYPSVVELDDGSLLSIFYAHPAKDAPAVIMQQRWKFEL